MQVEPVHQLALAVSSSPKLFACVLGSGVSRAANIRTGWQITLELVSKHAELMGEGDAAAKDPAAWYAKKYGREPDYSEVVSKLAPTMDLRRNLLEPYFTVLDQVTNERREHEPTAAHRSVARLVQRGLVRVIVTTNFDRLMENALREAGVASIEVVSSEEEALNCYPFHACECFVFKVHGDWKDTWLRNSNAELAEYPRGIAKLLRRIVSDHGLIVCGWSAEYDHALRQSIARETRRFPLFWADPKLGGQAQKLVAQLRGTHVAATGDEFFSELELATKALERGRPPPPLSGDVLVLRAQRLIEQKRDMALDELLQDTTRALCAVIERELDFNPDALASERVGKRAARLLSAAEVQAEPLTKLLIALARHAPDPEPVQRSLSLLLRSANRRCRALGSHELRWLAFYPAVLASYAFGVGCGYRRAWKAAITAVRDAGSGESLEAGEVRLPPFTQAYFAVPARGDHPSSEVFLGDRLANHLYAMLQDWIPRRKDFDVVFDRFEVILAALSLRSGDVWLPRCFMPRELHTASNSDYTFEETFENWFANIVLKAWDQHEECELFEAFVGCEIGPVDAISKLRLLAKNVSDRA